MSAKEMFEKMGYIVSNDLMEGVFCDIQGKKYDAHCISVTHIEDREYDEEDEYIEDESDEDFANRIGKYRVKEIIFRCDIFEPTIQICYKKIKVVMQKENFNVEYNGMGLVGEKQSAGVFGILTTPQEIKAINKQIEELGWNK